jgi:hypothetical protein
MSPRRSLSLIRRFPVIAVEGKVIDWEATSFCGTQRSVPTRRWIQL